MKTLKIVGIQMLFGLYLFLSVNNTFAQWPQWRGPNRDGLCAETNLLKVWPAEGPKLVWSVDKLGDGFSSTAIQDQMVFTAGKRDSVEIFTAMDLQGNVKWQKPFGRASQDKSWPQSRSTPTVYKNKVYAISALGDVACFDCKSGNIDWKVEAFKKFGGAGYDFGQNGIAESPLIFDDKLIITPCGSTTTMVALNRLTGETIWKSESIQDTTSFNSPVLISVNNKKAIFTSTKKYDLLVDCDTGKIIWKEPTISGYIPLVIKDQMYFSGIYKKGGSLCSWNDELNKRSVLWTDTINSNPIGGAVAFDDKLIVSGNSKGILCLDSKTGKILSHYDQMNYCTFVVADNMLYSYEDKMGRVSLFKMNGNNLELVSSFKITLGKGPRIAHLSIADGLLFIRRGEVLMAYDIKQR